MYIEPHKLLYYNDKIELTYAVLLCNDCMSLDDN